MSSQLAAPLPGGLPVSPPPDLRDFADPTWSDRMNLDHQPPNTDSNYTIDNQNNPRPQRTPSSSHVDAHQQRQAVGNLLAALNPVSPPKRGDTNPATAPGDNEEHPHVHVAASEQSCDRQANVTSADPIPLQLQTGSLDSLSNSRPPQDHISQLSPYSEISQPSATNIGSMASAALQRTASGAPAPLQPSLQDRREVEAFAKIEFEDGNYYITTWACELGRDALAYKVALARAEEAKNSSQSRPQSSSGRVSRPSDRVRRPGDSQVQGSVVSEAGGFGGVDDDPVLRNGEKKSATGEVSHSSQVSASDIVKPQEVLLNPIIPFDYHKNAERQAQMDPDNELPAPVTADHLPDADTCPLIPIHATTNSTKSEVATHKGISRRHVKIEWDFDRECFQMRVLGRNGAFLDGNYVPRGVSKRLSSGSKIQISDVQMTFRLPRPKTEPLSDDSDRNEAEQSLTNRQSTSPTSNDESTSPRRSGKSRIQITFSNASKPRTALADPLIGPDGQQIPPRKRGPGRPPKDGIMSTRERREREKALRLAEAKAANGGKTPPPMVRGKFPKPSVPEEIPKTEAKPEKRKYKKRKRTGDDSEILPSIEGGDLEVASDTEKVPVKKARASKSPSPEYPPQETLSEEQLARPSEPYARLIYDILAEIHPKALPLKQIYRALKLKFPFFVYRVDSEGWQSSVRHNLNQEWNKLFEKGEKEGKGFAWKAIPGALQPQAERKRAAQAAAAAKPKPQTAPRNQPPPQGPAPPLHWQNSTPFQPNGMQRGPPPPFWQQGPPGGYPPPPPNGMPWPPPPPGPMPLAGSPAMSGAPQVSQGQNAPHFNPHQPPSAQPSGPPPPQSQPPRPASSNLSQNPTAARLPSAQNSPAPQNPLLPPTTPSSGSAAPNMPCTLDGLMAIRRFETAMYSQVKDNTNGGVAYWQAIFTSVKNRMLHGAPESSMPGGESKEERTIMDHVRAFIEKFKNPNFVGFSSPQIQATSRTVSPSGPESTLMESLNSAVAASDKASPKDAVAKDTVMPDKKDSPDGSTDALASKSGAKAD